MTAEPQREVEVQGRVGEAVALPLASTADAGYVWTLDLGDEAGQVEAVAPAADDPEAYLRVRAEQPGSYVLTATLAEPGAETPMTVLPVRLTVS